MASQIGGELLLIFSPFSIIILVEQILVCAHLVDIKCSGRTVIVLPTFYFFYFNEELHDNIFMYKRK